MQLILAAKDHGSPSSFETLQLLTVLLVDTNDNDPEFKNDRYEFSVVENQPVGMFIGRVSAVDRDEGRHARQAILKLKIEALYSATNAIFIFFNQDLLQHHFWQ